MDIVLVAAIAENGVIGRGNALPWRLKSDMAHFRALTMGKPVVMGRKTYLSIGKPLERPHHDRGEPRPQLCWRRALWSRSSLDAALTAARGDALRRGADAIVVAGGAEIYAQTMERATRLAITASAYARRGRCPLSADRRGSGAKSRAASMTPAPRTTPAFAIRRLRQRRQAGGQLPAAAMRQATRATIANR